MKEMKLYKIVIRDNTPELVPISSSGTFQTPDGKLYWIIPVDEEQTPESWSALAFSRFTTHSIPTPSIIPQESPVTDEERVIALLKKGIRSVSEIARRAGTTPYSAEQIIHAAGLKTPTETLRDKIEETLRKAGAAGMSTYEIGKLAHSHQQIGPMMAGMVRQGKVWRLTNGNYAMYQTFNKEGNP